MVEFLLAIFFLLLLRVSTNLERKIKEKFSVFKMCLETKENVQMM